MRKLLLPFLFFVAACSSKQPDKKTENTDYIISMDGIEDIKLEMSQADVEKVIGKNIPLTNLTDTVSGSWQDSARINYKGLDLQLQFQRNYSSSAIFYMQLTGIKTSSPRCKTKAGVGIGSEKLKTIAAYEDSSLRLQPDIYETPALKSTITVYNYHDTRFIVFYLENKKVIAMETGIHFRDSE